MIAIAQDSYCNGQVPTQEEFVLLPSIKQASSKWVCVNCDSLESSHSGHRRTCWYRGIPFSNPAPWSRSLQPVLGGCLTQKVGESPEYGMYRQWGLLGCTWAGAWDSVRDGKMSLLADGHNLKVEAEPENSLVLVCRGGMNEARSEAQGPLVPRLEACL